MGHERRSREPREKKSIKTDKTAPPARPVRRQRGSVHPGGRAQRWGAPVAPVASVADGISVGRIRAAGRPDVDRSSTNGDRDGRVIQAKLSVGAADDAYEREADQIADQIMAQRSSAPAATDRSTVSLDRSSETAGGFAVGGTLESEITGRIGRGSPLPDDLRSDMEPRFGADFGDVRVHAGPDVESMNDGLGARAFTYGNDIFFGRGEGMTGDAGRRLVAHELTHVVQQQGVAQRTPIVRRVSKPEKVKWNRADTTTKAGVCPSSDGAMGGVVFISVGSDSYVIKPGEGSAANMLFAEEVLAKVGGAATSESQPVMPDSPAFAQILAVLRSAKDNSLAAVDGSELAGVADRWRGNWHHFENAPFFLVQKSMMSKDLGTRARPGADNQTFSEVYKADPLRVLEDPKFLYSIGRTLVADMVLGNADRLEAINGGNFFVTGTSKVGAIDNESFLPSAAQIEAFAATARGGPVIPTTSPMGELLTMQQRWVSYLVQGGPGVTKDAPVSNVEQVMHGFDRWVRTGFMSNFYKGVDQADADRKASLAAAGYPADYPVLPVDVAAFEANVKFTAVLENVRQGYQDGLAELTSRSKSLTKTFQALQAKYGADDAGLDFGAFKVRMAYMEATVKGADRDAAMIAAQQAATSLVQPKTARIVDFGVAQTVLTDAQRDRLNIILTELSPDDQKALIHIRPGAKKKLAPGDDDKYELLRAKLLKNFLEDYEAEIAGGLKAVVATTAFKDATDEATRVLRWFGGIGRGSADLIRQIWAQYNIPAPGHV